MKIEKENRKRIYINKSLYFELDKKITEYAKEMRWNKKETMENFVDMAIATRMYKSGWSGDKHE
jgi:hypothetical protein